MLTLRTISYSALALAASILLVTPLPAAVPQIMNYQGKLTSAGGAPVSDAVYNMRFYLYSQANGGALLWQEPANAQPAKQVQVTGGLFNVLLGSVVPLPLSAFEGNTWLQTEVNGSLLTPRVPIVSVGYAMRAAVADSIPINSVTGATIQDGSVTSADIGVPLSLTGSVPGSVIIGGGPTAAVIQGMNTSTGGGILQYPGVGVYGQNYQENSGYLGGTYGAYGYEKASQNFGYLGASSYGAYGKHQSSGNYGFLGSNSYGAYGQDGGTGAFGALGFGNYGVYGNDGTTGTYAGYFAGNVYVSGQLNVNNKAGATIPQAAGVVNANGTKRSGVGFTTVTWNAALQWYEISGISFDMTNYVGLAQPYAANNCRTSTVYGTNGDLIVQIYNQAGTRIQSDFSFVVYRL